MSLLIQRPHVDPLARQRTVIRDRRRAQCTHPVTLPVVLDEAVVAHRCTSCAARWLP